MVSSNPLRFHQNVVVMRHGDRLDNAEPLWAASATHPWDPPLDAAGKDRAFRTGKKFREDLGFPIHRVFVSPFLRCLQTAAEVVNALCADAADNASSNDVSKIKVAVEYGLSEMMNFQAIRNTVAPKDGAFNFDILKCEAILPVGTVDTTAKPVYKQVPQWQEPVKGARARYVEVVKSLADNHPSENLLIITHGEGLSACMCEYMEDDVRVGRIEYCAYSVSQRSIDLAMGDDNNYHSFLAGDFVASPKGLFGITLVQTP